MSQPRIQTYQEFWPFYLQEHSKRATKLWHAWGLIIAFVLAGTLAYFYGPQWLPLGFVIGYAHAWFSHFFIEKNRPATFKYPLWAFVSEFRMSYLVLTGRL